MGRSLLSTFRSVFPRNDWGDQLYALLQFRRRQHRWPRRENPEHFSDHLYRLKVDGTLKDPLRIFVTDKEYAKYYIDSVVGSQHVIETYGIVRAKSEVDQLRLDRLPCIVKPTHLSGHVAVHVESNQPVDRERLKQWLDLDYYESSRERNYKGLRPKIIVEEFFSEDGRTIPEDYKIFCFQGVPRLIQVDSGRSSEHTRGLYDTKWQRLRITIHKYPDAPFTHSRPAKLEEMLDLAARLSKPFSFIRVDMYVAKGLVKVGELTNIPGSAGVKIRPASGEITLGRLFAREEG